MQPKKSSEHTLKLLSTLTKDPELPELIRGEMIGGHPCLREVIRELVAIPTDDVYEWATECAIECRPYPWGTVVVMAQNQSVETCIFSFHAGTGTLRHLHPLAWEYLIPLQDVISLVDNEGVLIALPDNRISYVIPSGVYHSIHTLQEEGIALSITLHAVRRFHDEMDTAVLHPHVATHSNGAG